MGESRCLQCAVSSRYSAADIDADGICRSCREQPQLTLSPRHELETLFAKARDRDSQYDVVLGFSGGKDSLYGLHLLVNEFKLRPLLVSFDSGYRSTSGETAILRAAELFNVDIETYRPPLEEYDTIVREFFLKTGDVCLQCDLEVYSLVLQAAKKHQVGIVAVGGGRSEGLGQTSALRAVDVFDYAKVFLADLAERVDFDRFSISKEDFDGLTFVQLGDYFRWDHRTIRQAILEMGLELPGLQEWGNPCYIHHDCSLCRVHDYVRRRKRGFGRNEPSVAALVRFGGLDREEAAEILSRDAERAAERPPELDAFLERCGLSEQEFEEVVRDPNRRYCPPWYT